MKKIFGSVFLAAIMLMGVSSVASAAPTCTNQSISVGFSCSFDGLTFNFTNLSFNPTAASDNLQLAGATVSGNDAILTFQINPGTSGFPVDIQLGYTVTSDSANIVGIDASYAGANGSIFETASVNGTVVSTITDGNTGTNNGVVLNGTPATFGPYSSITISKDIDALSFSEFTDSVQISSVPEPMTLSTMGVGLLGLGLISRRRKQS